MGGKMFLVVMKYVVGKMPLVVMKYIGAKYGNKNVKMIFTWYGVEKCFYVVMKIWGAKIATGNPTPRPPSTVTYWYDYCISGFDCCRLTSKSFSRLINLNQRVHWKVLRNEARFRNDLKHQSAEASHQKKPSWTISSDDLCPAWQDAKSSAVMFWFSVHEHYWMFT